MYKLIIYFIFLFNFPFGLNCFSQDGILDNTFGNNGKVVTAFSTLNFNSISSAIQNSGKVIVLGSVYNNTQQLCSLVRYNPTGTIDPSFGVNGFVQTTILNKNVYVKSIIILSDNKILVVGYLSNINESNSDVVLIKYNQDGILDSSFGIEGIKIFDLGSISDYGNSLKIQNDNKIVVAGTSNLKFAVFRCLPNGNLDTSFGSNGIVITNIGGVNDEISSLNIQTDGKIVVSGYSVNNISFENFCLARYNVDGTLDLTFGNEGIVLTVVDSSDYDVITSQAILSDGKIIVSGIKGSTTNVDFTLVKYNSNGTLDLSFGNNGIVISDFINSIEKPFSMIVQPNGKIVIVGQSSGQVEDYIIARYNLNGSLDNNFNNTGVIIDNFGGIYNNKLNSVLLTADGKLLVSGNVQIGNNLNIGLARYTSGLALNNDDFFSSNVIKLYPNPCSDFFNIDLSFLNEDYEYFDVYDMLGRNIYSGLLNLNCINKIDISAFSKGSYLVCIINSRNNSKIKFKIIKN